MKVVGIALIVFGLVDAAGSFIGFDLWGGFLGIELPEKLWNASAYIVSAESSPPCRSSPSVRSLLPFT